MARLGPKEGGGSIPVVQARLDKDKLEKMSRQLARLENGNPIPYHSGLRKGKVSCIVFRVNLIFYLSFN